ncbi:PREDICTED: putative F-box protein At3g24580 [Camelina sativa]|uniref:F-box protein At3g24580 n=1 Tax=Camelina sativa TaxID=90675 RepID=A0ABM0XK22_CAMSA|nr:PREDICTED: putative F-box protein At3g24580 [Camelina sativa]
MEIWVTTKIEPNTVSWGSKFFLSADMRALIGHEFMFSHMRALNGHEFMFTHTGCSFFIDEEKKVAVVFDKSKDRMSTSNAAYIIGEDGSSLKEVELDLGESPNTYLEPIACSYVPSSVLLE